MADRDDGRRQDTYWTRRAQTREVVRDDLRRADEAETRADYWRAKATLDSAQTATTRAARLRM